MVKSVRKIKYSKSLGALLLMVVLLAVHANHAAAACGQTVTNTQDSGAGSLRQAITDANNNGSSVDTICFNIAGGTYWTIIVNSALPAITQPAVLDGSSQPGYSGAPVIEIDGERLSRTSGSPGIYVTAGSTTVKGLIVNRFPGDGIILNNNGGNTIQNNYVGTNSAGTAAFGNGASGIGMQTPNNTIGGTTPAERNLVSGNAGTGIAITNGNSNVIEGNYVGTDYTGTKALPNGADGILLTNAANNTIGGTTGVTVGGACTGACNLSSGNHSNGIGIWQSAATGNTVAGNYVGVNFNGDTALPNGDIGFEAQDAPNNTIGGTTPAERNIFSGNLGAGVSLTGIASTGDVVEGNYIGVGVNGSSAIGNHKMGVNLGSPSGGTNNSSNNTIGGTTGTSPGGSCSGACNVISGNFWSGIYISGGTGGANNIVGNFIGPGVSGGVMVGNQQDGVGIVDSQNNHFGGPISSARNLISGNGGNGIAIIGNATGTRIEGNYIGEGTDGGCTPNKVTGVVDQAATYVAVIGNNIFCSGFIGIDLGNNGVTQNHSGGAAGANELQNYPSLVSSAPAGANLSVYGILSSQASTSYRLDFFSGPYCDRSGHGQGQQFLGSGNITTDGSGNRVFSLLVDSASPGSTITATATKIIGGTPWETSEFSNCINVPRQHPDGTVVKDPGGPSVYLIENSQKRHVSSAAVMQSWSYGSIIKPATNADLNLADGADVYFREGAVLKGSGSNIYVIDQTGPSSFAKRRINSAAALNNLGYGAGDILQVSNGDLPPADGADVDASQHPDGTLVKAAGGSTIYLIENGQRRLVGSPGIFTSQLYQSSRIKTATSADMALANGSNVFFREGTLVVPEWGVVYVIDDTGSGFVRRPVSSPAVLSSLSYTGTDILHIGGSEIPIPDGPSL